MAATADPGPIDGPPAEPPSRVDPVFARRLVGAVLIAAFVAVFFLGADQSRLDTLRQDVAARTSGVVSAVASTDGSANCFQGFCFEEGAGFVEKWWEFSITYLKLVWPGLLLAVVVAAIVDGFLFPTRSGPAYGTWRTASVDSRVGLAETSLLPAHGILDVPSALLVGAVGTPALAMSIVLLTPPAWLTRLVVALVVAIPLLFAPRRPGKTVRRAPEGSAWDEIRASARSAARASWRFGARLVPLFVVAGVAGALATRFLTVAGVEAVAGRHLLGVALAAVFGLLLSLPLTFGLPIAAFGLIIGVDPLVAGVFLVTATLAGPRTVLASVSLPRRERVLAGIALTLALVGSAGALGAAEVARALVGGPRVAWDGEHCEYHGPDRLELGDHDITVRNDSDGAAGGRSLAVMIGRLPSNVSLDHFGASVTADPTGPVPVWFEVSGTAEFVLPGTEHVASMRFDDAGTYTALCLETTLGRPTGRFDAAPMESSAYPAEQTFEVKP